MRKLRMRIFLCVLSAICVIWTDKACLMHRVCYITCHVRYSSLYFGSDCSMAHDPDYTQQLHFDFSG